jgi:hypothetical protein
MSVFFPDLKITRSGLNVHGAHAWLAASFDAESNKGPIEIKVMAAAAMKWKQNGNRGAIPPLPWGLNQQPADASPWEVFDPHRGCFASAPEEWEKTGVGPAKPAHYVQMMVQANVALSLGKPCDHCYYGVWHPGKLWLFRTKHCATWTNDVLIPFLNYCYWREIFPALIEYQSGSSEAPITRDIQNDISLPTAVDEYGSIQEHVDVDLTSADDTVIAEEPGSKVDHYKDPMSLIPGGLHDGQADLKAITFCFESELYAILQKSGCDPFAAKTADRIGFILGVGSINKTWNYLKQVMVGFLAFATRRFSSCSSIEQNSHGFMKWLVDIGSMVPAFERLRQLVRCLACYWFQRASSKVGGQYTERQYSKDQMIPLKAAAGQDTYVDLFVHHRVRTLTASDEVVVSMLLGSEVNLGSHMLDHDTFVELYHLTTSRNCPEYGLTKEKWLSRILEYSSTASSIGGELNKLGTEAASSAVSSYGDIGLSGDGHELIATFFAGIFPTLPTIQELQSSGSDSRPTISWVDTSGHNHSENSKVDITGRIISCGAEDLLRTGRYVVMEHLRGSVFGQSTESSTDGAHSRSDVDIDSFDFGVAFGRTSRLVRTLETAASQSKRVEDTAAIERAMKAPDILVAYEKSRQVTQMRMRLKAYQTGKDRPESTRFAEFDVDADKATRIEIARCLEMWITQAPQEYREVLDTSIGPSAAQSAKSALIAKHINRFESTAHRDAAACEILRQRGLLGLGASFGSSATSGISVPRQATFTNWFQTRRGKKPETKGGFIGSLLSNAFCDDGDALQLLYTELTQTSSCSMGESKFTQMSSVYTRQQSGALKYLEERRVRSSVVPSPGASFWDRAVPPAGAGKESIVAAGEYSRIRGGKIAAPTITTKPAQQRKRGKKNEDHSTWTNAALKMFLREKGKKTTGSRSALIEWAKNVDSAPTARLRKQSLTTAYTVQRLRTELAARSLRADGGKSDLMERLESYDDACSRNAASLRQELVTASTKGARKAHSGRPRADSSSDAAVGQVRNVPEIGPSSGIQLASEVPDTGTRSDRRVSKRKNIYSPS